MNTIQSFIKNKQNLIELTFLAVFFILLSLISYDHVDRSFSVFKYFVGGSLNDLLDNYILYHHSLKDFIYHTSPFFRGTSPNGWNDIIYLLPLFIFCDLLGGLSVKTLCFFTVTTSLIFLFLFYYWMKKVWGERAAWWATLLLGSSAIFQEIARSGSYIAYSFLIVIIWLLYCFKSTETENPWYPGLLGLWTGLLWYGYGLIRGLTLVAVCRAWWTNRTSKGVAIGLFFAGMMIIIVPGIVVLCIQKWDHHEPWHYLFVDRENIFEQGKWNFYFSLRMFTHNLNVFTDRMLGGAQIVDHRLINEPHAHFLHRYFVIPMLIGMGSTFRSWKLPSNRLLIGISFMIFIIPMLSSNLGYAVARRSLFYIIPMYCFIGLGCKEIFDWMDRTDRALIKWLVKFLIIGAVLIAVSSEMSFVKHHVITPRRDMGILEFAEKIKQMGFKGNLYYLDTDQKAIYAWMWGGDILNVALMENGQSPLEVRTVTTKIRLTDPGKYFYLAKSPEILQKDFNDWAFRNKLEYNLIFESPFRSGFSFYKNNFFEPFKFYAVHQVEYIFMLEHKK